MADTNADIEAVNRALRQLGPDEVAVVRAVCGRMLLGRAQYGELRLDVDKRDWMLELEQELLDGIVYGAIQVMKRHRGGPTT